MKTAYIHIGTEKTGTSFLQQFLFKNREKLIKDFDILYPKLFESNNHQKLILNFAPDSIRTERIRKKFNLQSETRLNKHLEITSNKFAELVTKREYNKILISSEHFSSRLHSKEEISNVKAFFNKYDYDVKIILVLRHQAEVILSEYSTFQRAGNTGSFNINKENFWYNYFNLTEKWGNIFGSENIFVLKYSKKELLSNFTGLLGIKLNSSFVIPPTTNNSISAKSLELLNSFNKTFPRFKNDKNNKRGDFYSYLVKYEKQYGPFEKIKLTPQQFSLVSDKYAKQNQQIKQCFNIELVPNQDIIGDYTIDKYSEGELVKILFHLWATNRSNIDN